jgi:electron transfer flavoprotein alpha subunit
VANHNDARILVIAELSAGGEPTLATLAAVTFAKQLGRTLDCGWCLYAITDMNGAETSCARRLGASVLYYCALDTPLLPLPGRDAASIHALVRERSFDYVVAAATAYGRDLMPRIAAVLKAAYVGDCTGVRQTADGILLLRAVHAGVATAHCRASSCIVVVTAQPTAFDRAGIDEVPCPIVPVGVGRPLAAPRRARTLGLDATLHERPALTDARVVVAGGRVLGPRFFELLGPLADRLGAAIGATRAACDSGHVPGNLQIGQTGSIVAPDLYFAIGISGSVQHVAGMRRSRTIVAINNDPAAPIFAHADFGIVADLWQAVPQLVMELGRRKDASSRPNGRP